MSKNRFNWIPASLGLCVGLSIGCAGAPCPRSTVQAPPPPPPVQRAVRVAAPEPEVIEEWVHVPSQITFASDRSVLTEDGEVSLTQVADDLRGHDVLRVRVEGHINGQRQTDRGQQLSIDRARVVKERLIELGFSAEMFETNGLGGTQPVTAEQVGPRRGEQNRRVEVHALIRRTEGESAPYSSAS